MSQETRRIIFVDDESNILSSLKRMLRGKRREWEMAFAGSGEEALAMMAEAPFDVIVSDMRMPVMDGARLLKIVHDRHPETVRLVLSGYAELEVAMRAVQVAHQFLTKPCEPDRLIGTIERVCLLQENLMRPELRQVVASIEGLPSVPRVYQAICRALADPDASLDDVGALIEQDPAISVKVLQVVNSSLFSLARPITNIAEAASYLGLNVLKHITLGIEVFSAFSSDDPNIGDRLECERLHGHATAVFASRLMKDKNAQDMAFAAGLLHDIGRLVISTRMPARNREAIQRALDEEKPLHAAEVEVLGVSHCAIGADLLRLWGLPYPIIEAACWHHDPNAVGDRPFSVLDAVHIADALLLEAAGPHEDARWLDLIHLDEARVQALGLEDQVEEWREMARQTLDAEVSV